MQDAKSMAIADRNDLNPAEKSSKLPYGEKLIYSTGALVDSMIGNLVLKLAMPIYNIALGVNPALISVAMSVPRIWDGLVNPLMGNISDNTRTRFGRRRPYIALGSVFVAIFCVLMWMPPRSLGSMGLFIFFLIMSMMYFTSYTVFSVPYNALGLELTNDYNERTSVMAYKTLAMNLGGLLLFPWAYKLCFLPAFGKNEIEGVRVVGGIFAVIILVCGIATAFFCRETHYVKSQPKITFMAAWKCTMKNRPFLQLCGIMLIFMIGVYAILPLMMYINIYYVCSGNKEVGSFVIAIYNTFYGLVGAISIPFISYFSKHFGKKQTMLLGFTLVILSFFSSWFLYTPKYPYLQLICAFLASPGFSCIWVISASILADVCDIDELNTGLRREGMYNAVYGWITKLAMGCVLALSGVVVAFCGFNASIGANQSVSTLRNLRAMYAFVPSVFLLFALILTCFYSVDQEYILKVRKTIDDKRSQLNEK